MAKKRHLGNSRGKLKSSASEKSSKTINTKAWLCLIVVFGLLLRLYFYVGPNINDDVDYCWSAFEVSKGNFSPLYGGSINALRSMMTVPVAFFFWLFGGGEFQASIYPLLCSLSTIVATYLLGKTLINERVGLMGAALQSFFPLDVVFSTQLVPTTPVVMFASFGLFCFLTAEKIDWKEPGRKLWRRRGLLVISGVLFGFAHLASETGVIVTMFIGFAYLIYERKLKIDYSLVLLGFLTVFTLETSVMYLNTGDPWHRLVVIHETEIMIGTNLAMDYYPRVMLRIINPNYWSHEGNLGIHFYLFMSGSVYALLKKQKNALFLVLTFILIMGYFEFGVMTTGFKPIAKWVRYLIVFGPTFSLVIANLVDHLHLGRLMKLGLVKRYEEVLTFLIRPLAVMMVFAISWQYLVGATGAYNEWTRDFKEEYKFLNTLPPRTVYADQGSIGFIKIYSGWKIESKGIEGMKLGDIHDAYVLVNASSGAVDFPPMRDSMPYNHEPLPDDWILLKTVETSRIKPKIFLAPLLGIGK
jgi:4-amino-4-deoxy-L-arabinose transferase-like glycosyltransferase